MTSAINPNNINTAYPVAGQDNNTQGFRDNFTFIKVNFESAADEITALQNAVVTTGSGTVNDLSGALVYDARLQDTSLTRVALGTVSGGTATINYASGHYQTMTMGASTTLAFTNLPATGSQGWIIVRVTVSNVSHLLTFPSAVGAGASAKSIIGIQGIVSRTIRFVETGTYEFLFNTEDGGSSIYVSELTRPRNLFTNPLFLNSAEDLAASAAASLLRTTSYFTTAAAETATLAAGTSGQIKVFAASSVTSGNMVITVTNAGWKVSGTGTITFNSIGQGCTLQYVNSKWYCIGNNGCIFA
jgi:hypothetical protein